jgi:sugar-specific transcriptional regulator TrmB
MHKIYKSKMNCGVIMDDEIQILHELQEFGLSDQEALLYLTLLRKSSTASEVAKRTDIPRTRVYEIARDLDSKGFIEMSLSRPLKLRAMQPEMVFKRLKAEYEKKIKNIEDESPELINLLNNVPEEKEEEESIWSVNGENNIISKFNELCENATKEICFTTSRFSALDKIEKTLLNCKSNNISIMAAVPVLDCTKPYVRRLATHFNVRHFDHRIRFLLVDRAHVLIFLVDPTAGIEDFKTGNLPACEKSLYSQNRSLVYIFSQFFDDIWKVSFPVKELLK